MSNLALVFENTDFNKFKKFENITFLPLSMEALLHCENNKLNYLEPKLFFKKKDHLNGQIFAEKILKNISIEKGNRKFLEKNFLSKIRYIINFCFFIKSIIYKVDRKYDFKKILISKNLINLGLIDFDLSLLIKLSHFKRKIEVITKTKNIIKDNAFKFKLSNKNFIDKKIDFCFFVTGYNLKRLIIKLLLINKKILLISLGKVSMFKKLLFKLRNIEYIEISKKEKIKSNLRIKIKKNPYYKLLLYISEKFNSSIENLYQQKIILDQIFSNNKISYTVTHNSLDNSLSLIKSAKEYHTKTILISHGTVSKTKNKQSKKYNNLISENLYSKYIDFSIVQSKISKSYIYNKKIKKLNFGNIIYANTQRTKKSYILYAVTSKNFNIHFWGQELYFEFYENLKFLNSFANKEGLKILVKLHPNYQSLIKSFKISFKSLLFSNDSIEKLLKNAEACISLSSTSIEDALLSRVPVILFDRFKRYKHYDQANINNKKNCPIYYVKEKNKLIEKIKVIQKSNNIKFDNFLYSKNVNRSLKKFVSYF